VPSSDPAQRFHDILDNISRIEQYTEGMDLVSFLADHKTRDAVERCLSRISEGSTKLGTLAETLCPGIPWPDIRGLGNFLRHEYDRLEGDRIWFLVEDNLPSLKTAAQQALRTIV
jgi:uncharacterized protein with HEPN domain